jgi:hypothetical protein
LSGQKRLLGGFGSMQAWMVAKTDNSRQQPFLGTYRL